MSGRSTFPQDLVVLARTLARLHEAGKGALTSQGAAMVLRARSDSLRLVAKMVESLGVMTHPDVSASTRRRHRDPLRLLARVTSAPLQSMGMLARIEAEIGAEEFAGSAISQLLGHAPRGSYERRWRQVLIAATVAHSSFDTLPKLDRTSMATWTIATEAAALAAAIATLDEVLLPRCREALPDADLQTSVAQSHLRPAASAVAAAGAGPVPTMDAVVRSASVQAVAVTSGRTLIEAMEQLPRLVREESPPRVAHIRQACIALHLGLEIADRVLDAPHSRRARDIAAAVHDAAYGGDPQVREVQPFDLAAPTELSAQLVSLTAFLARMHRGAVLAPSQASIMSPALGGFVDFAPAVVHACMDQVESQLRAGAWASTVGPAGLALQRYTPSTHGTVAARRYPTASPRLLSTLRRAAHQAGPDRRLILSPELAEPNKDLSAAAVLADVTRTRRPAAATDLDRTDTLLSSRASHEDLRTLVRRAASTTGADIVGQPHQSTQPALVLTHQHLLASDLGTEHGLGMS